MKTAIILILFFSLLISWKITSRKQLDCFGGAYIFLVVGSITILSVLFSSILISKTIDSVSMLARGQKADATVVSYLEYYSEGKLMYNSTYKIVTEAGNSFELDSNYGTGKQPVVGETLSVYVDEKTRKIIEFSVVTIIMVVGSLLLGALLIFGFVGIVRYAFGFPMRPYYKAAQIIGMKVFIPAMMIAFEGLLIYALFYGNDGPPITKVILVFFTVMLGLTIVGYIKQFYFSKGKMVWVKNGVGSWSGYWDDEDDEKVRPNKRNKVRKPKKMVPLETKYLDKKKGN